MHGTSLAKINESLKIPGILVHRDVNDATKDGKDTIPSFEAFFEFQIFVPERMC